MERIGAGVGISSQISAVVRRKANFGGESSLLPITSIPIDVASKVSLSAFRPRVVRKRVVRSISVTAASAEVSVVESVIGNGTGKPRSRRSGTRLTPRRKRKSTASASEDCSPTENLELQRLAEALESVYHKDATTTEADYEGVLKALEIQTRTSHSVGAEEAVSCSSPTMSSVRKRRGRPPRDVVDHDSGRFSPPPVISPQKTREGFIVRSAPSIVVRRRVGEGKCRLNLGSRISLRKKRQEKSLQSEDTCTDVVKAGLDIWSPEAENLIRSYGMVLDLAIINWDGLQRGLLSAETETQLALLMKPMKTLKQVRDSSSEDLGRDPTDEEWASAAKMDENVLRRQLLLGKSARNMLIQHNLRLVLSQAHKYYKPSSSLSLFDLCQEGVSGLLHGVDKFDYKRGHRFSTYAVYWVRNSILRAQTRSGSSVRSPINMGMHKLNIKRARLELLVELERAPTDEEVMKRLGLSANRYRDILCSSARVSTMNKKSVITGEELVESIADRSELKRWGKFGLDEVLESLKPRESLVLKQRFGLDGQGERTLKEIGQSMGLSREMVRKYEICALMKMKQPTRLEQLRSFL